MTVVTGTIKPPRPRWLSCNKTSTNPKATRRLLGLGLKLLLKRCCDWCGGAIFAVSYWMLAATAAAAADDDDIAAVAVCGVVVVKLERG